MTVEELIKDAGKLEDDILNVIHSYLDESNTDDKMLITIITASLYSILSKNYMALFKKFKITPQELLDFIKNDQNNMLKIINDSLRIK